MSNLQEVEKFWARVCFDPHYQPEGRFKTYRELVFQGMLDVLESMCPIAYHILSEGEWRQLFWEFLRKAPPQSVILRTLPNEVAQYLKVNDFSLGEKYPYLGELMEYEYLEVQVRFAPEDDVETPPGTLRLNPAHALRHYGWPVHFISEENHDPKKLPQGDFYLFVWRDPNDLEVKFMEVNPLVAALFQDLKTQAKGAREVLENVAREMALEVTEEYREEGRKLIQDLISKGILISAP